MWPDKQTIVQIIVLLFFAGAAVVQVLFRALAKAQRPQPPRPAPPGGGPEEKSVKNVRDFLKEIRAAAEKGVAEARQGESRKVPVPSEGQVLVWETVEEPRVAPATQPTGPRARDRDGSRRSDRDRRRAEEGPPAKPESKGVHEYLEDLARRETGDAEPAVALPAESQTASLETALEKKLKVRSAGAKRALPRPAGPLVGGLTVRDAMIAQVILGPPRCRGRHTRRSSL